MAKAKPVKPSKIKKQEKRFDPSGESVCPECEIKLKLNLNGSIPAHSSRAEAGMIPCDGGITGLYFFRLWSKKNTKGEHE